jgi:hypothetical protein
MPNAIPLAHLSSTLQHPRANLSDRNPELVWEYASKQDIPIDCMTDWYYNANGNSSNRGPIVDVPSCSAAHLSDVATSGGQKILERSTKTPVLTYQYCPCTNVTLALLSMTRTIAATAAAPRNYARALTRSAPATQITGSASSAA